MSGVQMTCLFRWENLLLKFGAARVNRVLKEETKRGLEKERGGRNLYTGVLGIP